MNIIELAAINLAAILSAGFVFAGAWLANWLAKENRWAAKQEIATLEELVTPTHPQGSFFGAGLGSVDLPNIGKGDS